MSAVPQVVSLSARVGSLYSWPSVPVSSDRTTLPPSPHGPLSSSPQSSLTELVPISQALTQLQTYLCLFLVLTEIARQLYFLRTESPQTPLASPRRGTVSGKGPLGHAGQASGGLVGGEGACLAQRRAQQASQPSFLIPLQLLAGSWPPTWVFVKAPGTWAC